MSTRRRHPRIAVVAELALAVLVAVVAVVALVPAPALADGDPASDFLLEKSVFYPVTQPPSQQHQDKLDKALTNANVGTPRGRERVKAAIIASPLDLGTAGALMGKPQQYADFLYREIKYTYKGALVVVMPQGVAVVGVTPKEGKQATEGVKVPKDATVNEMADVAAKVVTKVGEQRGGKVEKSSNSTVVLLIIGIVVGIALFVAVGIFVARLSKRRANAGEAATPADD